MHYFDSHTAPFTPFPIRFRAKGREFSAVSSSDLFSKDKLDQGTGVLLEAMEVQGDRILDYGCGWGAVGMVIEALWPDKSLTCLDVNPRAISLARKNIQKATFIVNDGLGTLAEQYDTILLNPPYAAGRQTCYRLINEAHEHLAENGLLQVVARHQKGGAMIEQHMHEVFGNVTTLAKKSGFRVYKSVLTNKP